MLMTLKTKMTLSSSHFHKLLFIKMTDFEENDIKRQKYIRPDDASDSRYLRGLLELEVSQQSLLRSHVTLKVRVHLRSDEVHLTLNYLILHFHFQNTISIIFAGTQHQVYLEQLKNNLSVFEYSYTKFSAKNRPNLLRVSTFEAYEFLKIEGRLENQ